MQKISAFCFLSLLCIANAQFSFAPSSLIFSDVQIGQTMEGVVYIINDGYRSINMSGVGGDVDTPFSVTEDCQGDIIGPGQACSMYFYFTPNTTGFFSAVSQGTWNGYPFNISLFGNVVPELNIAPSSINFGIVPVGEIIQKGIFITNVGDDSIELLGDGGDVEAPFQVSSQDCQSTTLSPGDTCEMLFTFTPTTTGSVATNSVGTWNGQPFNITLTANVTEIIA